jgi:CRISPR-associated protein Csd1
MTVLSALSDAYERLASRGQVPPFGYSQEKIGFVISLTPDGRPAIEPADLRQGEGRKRQPRMLAVPKPVKRTSGIAPNFLWDKTAYVLGVTAGEGKRTADEHAAFVARHAEWLSGTDDPGLRAFLAFLDRWRPEHFEELAWPDDMKDQNIVFALEDERRRNVFLHDRAAARAIWSRLQGESEGAQAVCLVTGERGPVARLHPAVKGVWGAQSSGASIVSFNLDAFTSYGHEQGENAPVSEQAAFAYVTALNTFLARDSGHRIQIGDASTVFWADGSGAEVAEAVFGSLAGESYSPDQLAMFASAAEVDEAVEAAKVGRILGMIRDGRPVAELRPDLPEGVRFHVLGLAPNAARLSIRFYVEDDFAVLAERYARHLERLRVAPPAKDPAPSMWRLLIETATLHKTDNIRPNLAGDWLRAILTDAPYPLTLMASVLERLRADGDVNALRVGILKSVLIRNFAKSLKGEVPVSLDKDCREPGYLLGRLFALYEKVQTDALGRNVNATIKDKYYGAASAQPRKIFPYLEKGSAPHLSKIGKQRPGQKIAHERLIGEIMDMMSPEEDPFPARLPDRQQALFALGYYHQRSDFFRKHDTTGAAEDAAEEASA